MRPASSWGKQYTRPRALAALGAVVVAGCLAVSLAPARASGSLTITADQGLYPAFNTAVHDYVIRCTGSPVQVSVNAPLGYGVSVDGSAMTAGSFTQSVPLSTGQEFSFSVRHSEVTTPYYVRCLPTNFPRWTFTPESPVPFGMFAVDGFGGNYTAVFDSDGVPVWWMLTSAGATDSQVLRDSTYAFYDRGSGIDEVYSLAGKPIRSLTAINGTTDQHELMLLENGDYMIDSYVQRSGVDLSPYGGPSNTTVLDGEAEEITPAGALVWSWNSGQHTSLSDTPQSWYNRQLTFGAPYDIFHLNAIQPDGSTVLISARHTDAVWGVSRTTGNVLWKLGGTPNAASLNWLGDPQGNYPFGGQHDIRLLPDGTLTIHDNNYGLNLTPRVMHFSVNPSAGTATYIGAFTDPAVTSALCCGSARVLPTGQTLVSWGYNPLVAEYDSSGHQLFALTFAVSFSYRANPVPLGVSISALRTGMDTQYPRPIGGAPVHSAPVAAFTASAARITVHTALSLHASAGTSRASYSWDFGDGTSGTGAVASHRYGRPGQYLVRLTVRDSGGEISRTSHSVVVLDGRPQRPLARFEAPHSARVRQWIGFDASYSLVSHATIVRYVWRFGDGARASGEMVAHRYVRRGTYRVTLTVTSSAGRQASRTEIVRVR
jgi:chitodextrinase